MHRKISFIYSTAVLVSLFILSAAAYAVEKPVMLFYYSYDCVHCMTVKTDFLPEFLERYSEHFEFVELEVTDEANRDSLYAMEARLNVPEAYKDYPAVYFMGTMLEGENDVRLKLGHLVESYLANPDSAREVDRAVMARTPEPVDFDEISPEKTVHMAYFFEEGCRECGRASEIIDWLESMYDAVEINQFDIQDRENKILATALGIRTGIPENRIMSTPVFFIGNDCILSEDISRNTLSGMIAKYAQTGAPPAWESFTGDDFTKAENYLKTQFTSFALLAVALAGLGDGINPCAFATILFFVSYLGMVGRKKNEILIVGLSFAAAVFATYFLVGLGFLQFVRTMTNFDIMAKIIFGGTAVLCIVFGILSIYDYVKAAQGKTGEMMLQLPTFLKKRIHKTIREKSRMNSMVAGAFIAGFTVSILEFACTGQVYLPTITFMVGVEGLKSTAVLYLILYNIFFILPLLLVFSVVYFGVSSKAISKIMESRVGTVKLILAGVFFTVGVLLFWAAFM